MRNIRKSDKGLTLIEAMISVAIIVIIFEAAASTIISSQVFSSLARHKLQAAYAAQQLLEQQRRLAFSTTATSVSVPVILDTMGTYDTTQDDFTGTAFINVTPIDAYRDKVQVEIDWQERLLTGAQVTMREYYATTIANDPQLN